MTAEQTRLDEAREKKVPWKKWGPYLSERQWGTVREDYSEGGDAWNYFTHDQARSRAYRWGEDGLAGISDDKQRLCFALALVERQGPDPQGTPVRPDQQREQSRRGRQGILLLPRQHADPFVHEVPLQVSAGGLPVRRPRRDQPPPRPARVRVRTARHRRVRPGSLLRRVRRVCQGIARGHPDPDHRPQPRPRAGRAARPADALVPQPVVLARAIPTGRVSAQADGTAGRASSRPSIPSWASAISTAKATCRCCSRRTKPTPSGSSASPTAPPTSRTASTTTSSTAGQDAVNPEKKGTKAAAHYRLTVAPGECQMIRLRLSRRRAGRVAPGQRQTRHAVRQHFDERAAGPPQGGRRVLRRRSFRRRLTPTQANVMRQALAGMLWSKQFYHYDVDKWLEERGSDPFKPTRKAAPRNDHWHHMYNGDVISMPDKWEYPWYAAWDLAFHVLALTLVDADFGKQQLQADAARALHAPQRPDPGLRVELRRRQPAGACLVHHLHLPPGQGDEGRGRHATGSRAASRSCC